jgi:hypothetical protein
VVTVNNTKNKNAGYAIYDVNALDAENDTLIYTMTSSPSSNNFEIGPGRIEFCLQQVPGSSS